MEFQDPEIALNSTFVEARVISCEFDEDVSIHYTEAFPIHSNDASFEQQHDDIKQEIVIATVLPYAAVAAADSPSVELLEVDAHNEDGIESEAPAQDDSSNNVFDHNEDSIDVEAQGVEYQGASAQDDSSINDFDLNKDETDAFVEQVFVVDEGVELDEIAAKAALVLEKADLKGFLDDTSIENENVPDGTTSEDWTNVAEIISSLINVLDRKEKPLDASIENKNIPDGIASDDCKKVAETISSWIHDLDLNEKSFGASALNKSVGTIVSRGDHVPVAEPERVKSIETISQPEPEDIPSGRGSFWYNHPGNVHFRNVLFKHFEKYEKYRTAKKKSDMTSLATYIVKVLVSSGRRFLKKGKNRHYWTEMNGKEARDKVSYTFRSIRDGKIIHPDKRKRLGKRSNLHRIPKSSS